MFINKVISEVRQTTVPLNAIKAKKIEQRQSSIQPRNLKVKNVKYIKLINK